MAVPRNRTSNARKNSRRSHHAKKPRACAGCPNCGKPKLPHVRCPFCAIYNGRMTLSV
ncbi:MAG: 50S ribosomal protein L32 [Chlamydiia bacterium]